MELVMEELEVMVEVVMLEMQLVDPNLQEIMLYKVRDQVVVVLDTLLYQVMVVGVVLVLFSLHILPVSYTHLTLPTNREV